MRSTPPSLRALCAAPRAHLFTMPQSLTRSTLQARHLSTSPRPQKDDGPSSFSLRGMPSPPRLPKEEQEIFETLQRQSTGAFSTPIPERRSPPRINQSPDSSPAELADAQNIISERVEKIATSAAAGSESTGAEEQSSTFKDM